MVLFIEEAQTDDKMSPGFKLAELAQLYKSRTEQLEMKHNGRMHTTQRLQAHFLNMCAQQQGQDVPLASNEDLSEDLTKACELNRDFDAVHLSCPNCETPEMPWCLTGFLKDASRTPCHSCCLPWFLWSWNVPLLSTKVKAQH